MRSWVSTTACLAVVACMGSAAHAAAVVDLNVYGASDHWWDGSPVRGRVTVGADGTADDAVTVAVQSGKTGSASASINSPNGVLRATATTPVIAPADDLVTMRSRATSRARVTDTLVFSGSQVFTGLLRATIMGTLYDPSFVSSVGSSVSAGIFSMSALYAGTGSSYSILMVSNRTQPGWCVENVTDECLIGTDFWQTIEIPFEVNLWSRDVDLSVNLTADALNGGASYFGSSAYLELIGVPDGVTYTSSTALLSAPVAIPGNPDDPNLVPEPTSLVLVAPLVLGLAASAHRRRTRTAGMHGAAATRTKESRHHA